MCASNASSTVQSIAASAGRGCSPRMPSGELGGMLERTVPLEGMRFTMIMPARPS